MTTKTRIIDGRTFVQRPDGKWEPSAHQKLIDRDRVEREARKAAATQMKASAPTPITSYAQSNHSDTLLIATAMGLLFFL